MPAGCQDFDNIESGEWETDSKSDNGRREGRGYSS